MASFLWSLCLSFLFLVSGARSAQPKKPVDVQFSKNYVPTWSFDHIKYFNGGAEAQLILDKYTGNERKNPILITIFFFHYSFSEISLFCSVLCRDCINKQEPASSPKALTCLVTLVCT